MLPYRITICIGVVEFFVLFTRGARTIESTFHCHVCRAIGSIWVLWSMEAGSWYSSTVLVLAKISQPRSTRTSKIISGYYISIASSNKSVKRIRSIIEAKNTCAFPSGSINWTRICGDSKWYRKLRPALSCASTKSPSSIKVPTALSSRFATLTQACAGCLVELESPTLARFPLGSPPAAPPVSISIKHILRRTPGHVKAPRQHDGKNPTHSGVFTATTARPVSNLLNAIPAKWWRIRRAMQTGGLNFRSQHWKVNARMPWFRVIAKEKSQFSPLRERNFNAIIRESGTAMNSTCRVGLGDCAPESQFLLYLSALSVSVSSSWASSVSRGRPWRPGIEILWRRKYRWI